MKAIDIIEAQNRTIESFIVAFESGKITEAKYKELVQDALNYARDELAK